MFTLKFYTGGNYEVISVHSYQVDYRHTNEQARAVGSTIIAYSGEFRQGGVEYHMGANCRPDSVSPDICYVENSAGKTIDKIQLDKGRLAG